jgi:hypothetical protein
LWDDVTVGAGAEVRECILADGVVIPAAAVFERCAIVRDDGTPPERNELVRDGLLVAPLEIET